jgi:hypothetical protein
MLPNIPKKLVSASFGGADSAASASVGPALHSNRWHGSIQAEVRRLRTVSPIGPHWVRPRARTQALVGTTVKIRTAWHVLRIFLKRKVQKHVADVAVALSLTLRMRSARMRARAKRLLP